MPVTPFIIPKIILATSSKWRAEAFGFLDIDFTSESSDVEENITETDPEKMVAYLARLKAYKLATLLVINL